MHRQSLTAAAAATSTPSFDPALADPRALLEVAPAEVTAETGESQGFLAPYFRDLAHVDVMTRDEELAAAILLTNLRKTDWKSILGYPPFIDGICDLARAELPAETCPVAALDSMKKASRNLRDRDLLVHQKAYEAACEALTLAMAEADRHCRLSGFRSRTGNHLPHAAGVDARRGADAQSSERNTVRAGPACRH